MLYTLYILYAKFKIKLQLSLAQICVQTYFPINYNVYYYE